MKILGAGAAIGTLGSGVAAADEHEEEPMDHGTDTDGPTDGHDTDTPMEGTVHTVRTLITQSTNPERPADFFYQPTGIHIEPGDVIKFVFETPDHTVTSYHPAFGMQRRVPAGVGPFSSPIIGWDPQSLPDDIDMPPSEGGENGDNGEHSDGPRPGIWLHAFDVPGVYDLECAPHEGYGMAMRVVVGDETETQFETTNSELLPPPRAGPVGFARHVLTDSALEPESIVAEGYVEWMDLEMNQETAEEEGETEDGDETAVENGTDTDDENENGADTDDGSENGVGEEIIEE